ncbi:MAG: [LysW]-lysine hydrolase [Phycisphaerales bacterium]|nr:[LysW]-lysine hydrolase [Phycisphaerales bacterium]
MSTAQHIDDSIAVRILEDLVSTPSVSGSERSAVEVFARHAVSLGFTTEIDAAGNAIARLAGRAPIHRRIALLGHIDTVPGDIPVRIDGGVLHGRGSVDAKGPLCAMLLGAASCGAPDGIELLVIGAVGEETTESPGARFLRDRLRPDACIIGEPSGWDGVTLGYKGRLVATAMRTQDCSHSAGPERSPGDALFAWWRSVTDHIDAINAGRERAFDRVQATINTMQSGADGLASNARMVCGFRLPEDVPPETLEERLRACAREFGVEVRTTGHESAYATLRTDPVVRALSAAIRAEGGAPRHKLKTGTADLNVVAPVWRCPIAAYGPGDSALDHTPDEHISIDEYLRSIRVITRAVSSLADELLPRTAPCTIETH